MLVAESRAESLRKQREKRKINGAEEFSALVHLRKFACRSCVRRAAALPSRGK